MLNIPNLSPVHHKRIFARKFLVSLALLGAVPFSAQANLLTNGSFESPSVPNGNFTSFSTGSVLIPGWTVTGPAGTSVSIVNTAFTQNGVTFQAGDANQWLDLTGAGVNSTEGLSQVVVTTPGNVYQLTYLIGNTSGGGAFGTASNVKVLVNGLQTFSDTNSTISATSLNWGAFSHNFTASGASTTLLFQNGDPSSDNSNGLDNVVLLDLGPGGGTSVPAPASFALILLGMGSLGLARKRFKG
jgi:Protein of unknown function (DUF642)